MNVEIGTEAALFPEKEHIKRIFFAVQGEKHGVKREMVDIFFSIPRN
jgi:hypothetical protein